MVNSSSGSGAFGRQQQQPQPQQLTTFETSLMATTAAPLKVEVAHERPPAPVAADQQQQQLVCKQLNPSSNCRQLTNRQSQHAETEGNQQQQEKRYRPQKFCSVCGDKAIACNFNAVTCESCKAFFRRNAYKEQRLKCLFERRCLITKDTRRFCSKCRLLKCFAIGMKREWILTDEQKHSKRVKIIQNKETKQKQLASITMQTNNPSSTSLSSSSAAAAASRYPCGHHLLLMSSSSPASSANSMATSHGVGRSETSSPANTTATKNSLCSSREASLSSRPDSSHGLAGAADQQQHLPVAAVQTLFREAKTSFVETKDASTWTCPDEQSPAIAANHCSWSTQCHFCSIKLANNNNNTTNGNNGLPLVASAMLAPGPSLDLIHNNRSNLSHSTSSVVTDFRGHHLSSHSDELVGAGNQALTTQRLFYSTTTDGGGTEANDIAKQQLQAASMMAASSYVANAGNALAHSELGSNHHLLQFGGGAAISRPVTNYCFNANAGRLAASAQQQLDGHQHHYVQPSLMSSLADSDSASQYSSSNNNNLSSSSPAGSNGAAGYLSASASDDNTTPTATTNNNSANPSLLCFPLSTHTSQQNLHHQTSPINHHQQLQASNPMLHSRFVQASSPNREHFGFPAGLSHRTNMISDTGGCKRECPPQQTAAAAAAAAAAESSAAAYDSVLQAAVAQQCGILAPDQMASSDSSSRDNNSCSLAPNSNNMRPSSSSHQSALSAGCSPASANSVGDLIE